MLPCRVGVRSRFGADLSACFPHFQTLGRDQLVQWRKSGWVPVRLIACPPVASGTLTGCPSPCWKERPSDCPSVAVPLFLESDTVARFRFLNRSRVPKQGVCPPVMPTTWPRSPRPVAKHGWVPVRLIACPSGAAGTRSECLSLWCYPRNPTRCLSPCYKLIELALVVCPPVAGIRLREAVQVPEGGRPEIRPARRCSDSLSGSRAGWVREGVGAEGQPDET
jgi:hypothetical protein